MPSFEAPTFNSSRVQRAYRINNLETHRLQGKLKLIEKERVHQTRLSNQDVRLISVTLDYINSCSGHSPEGLAPDASQEEIVQVENDNPCFLYGERIISRKRRRIQRPQSATVWSKRSQSAWSDASSSTSVRPQSSPVKGPNTFVTSLKDNDEDDNVSSSGNESLVSSSSSQLTNNRTWIDETTEITKKLLRANLTDNSNVRRRGSLHQRQFGRRRSQSATTLNLLTRTRQSLSLESPEGAGNRKSSSVGISKSAGIMDILNQRRPTLSANAWKTHLNQTKNSASPMTFAAQNQHVMDVKMNMNHNRKDIIDKKVKGFMTKLGPK